MPPKLPEAFVGTRLGAIIRGASLVACGLVRPPIIAYLAIAAPNPVFRFIAAFNAGL